MFSRSYGHTGALANYRRTASALGLAAIAAGSLWTANVLTSTEAGAKTPGKTYCFVRKCHRVMTLDETRRAVGRRMVVVASHYDSAGRDRFNPSNVTSSGEYFRAGAADNAASPNLPNGTVILAWNPATKQSAVLRINNAGPYWGNRTLDVSRGAAQRLGFGGKGVASLHVRVLRAPSSSEATYSRGRRYAAVPGPIGAHASLELAVAAANSAMGRSPGAPATTVAVAAASPTARKRAKPSTPATVAQAPASTTSAPTTMSPPAATATPVATAATRAAAPVIAQRRTRVALRSSRQLTSVVDAATAIPVRTRSASSRGSLPGDDNFARASRRVPECQGWVGSCTVTGWTTSSAVSRSKVASVSSNR